MRIQTMLIIAFLVLTVLPAAAHTPLCACFDNGDSTVTCEGGFSNGGSAAGVDMRITTPEEKVLQTGEMDADGEFTFTKPDGEYVVVFDAGDAHILYIPSGEIF